MVKLNIRGWVAPGDILQRDYSLIVLAGGKGKRLGQEKAWVELEGQTLLERSISRLGSLVKQVIVVSAPGQVLPDIGDSGGVEIVEDIYPGKGPFVGIYSGLKSCVGEGGFVTACDMPFVNPEFARYLISLSPGFDVVVPLYGELLEPLHAFYSIRCAKTIEDMIENQDYKIDHLLQKVRVRYVKESEIDRLDPKHVSFFNINTREDLEKAQRMAFLPPEQQQLITRTEIT